MTKNAMKSLSTATNNALPGSKNNRADALKHLKKRRQAWLHVHLWLGLIAGFFLALIGVTGSILVFHEEIDKVLNAKLFVVEAPSQGEAAFRPFAEIQAAAAAVMPSEAEPGFIAYPSDARSSYVFGYFVPALVARQADEWQVYVDPYSAQVLGKKPIKKAGDLFPGSLIPFVWRLHFALLAGDTGSVIVGILGVLLMFSVLTGLILWWPLTGHWRRVLTIKPRAGAERFNHDLHQVAGFYTFPVLFVVVLSGVYMNLPEQFMALVKQFSPSAQSFMDMPRSAHAREQTPIGLAAALTVARSRYPEGRLEGLYPADGENGVYRISIREVPGLSHFWSGRQIIVDQYSGAVLQVRDPGTRSTAAQTFIDWQWPLHSGKAFGWTGRILVFITGLLCPVLFVTGVIRWLQKRRARRKTLKRLSSSKNYQ
jgi:uncharacterized iron-regulated membrane protein